MIDALREEGIVNKVGGRFKLSTLIQKRLVALNAGARPLVEVHTNDKMQIVIAEIINDKISLDTSGNLRITGASDADGPSLTACPSKTRGGAGGAGASRSIVTRSSRR